jgi:hypothetical protein
MRQMRMFIGQRHVEATSLKSRRCLAQVQALMVDAMWYMVDGSTLGERAAWVNSNPNQVRRVLLAAMAIAIWILTTITILFTHLPLVWIVCISVALMLVVTLFYCIIAYRTYLTAWVRPTAPPQFDAVRIIQDIARYESQIQRDSAILFANSLFNPYRFFTRVAETVRTSSRAMTIDSVFQLSLPGTNGNNFAIFPITQVSRTLSPDSIHVSDSSGATLATLNYDQRLAIMGACLRKFVQQCSGTIYEKYIGTLEQTFVHMLAAEQPNPALNLRNLQAHLTSLAGNQNGQSKRDRRILTAAAWLMELMVTRRPVIVLLPLARKSGLKPDTVIHLQRRLIAKHRESTDATRIDRARDRVRLLMGVRPTILSVPLSYAALTKAYHLEVIGPRSPQSCVSARSRPP